MKLPLKEISAFAIILISYSCSILEKSSVHSFNSDYYKLKINDGESQEIYAEITDNEISIHTKTENEPQSRSYNTVPLITIDSSNNTEYIFSKKSLDIDITSILFKYRPSVSGQQPQMVTDFNASIYAGWRQNSYIVRGTIDPIGKNKNEILNRGYDFGLFCGPGTTLVSPFTTKNLFANEYNGMIIQFGLAGFIESNVASFGIAVGYDYLLSRDYDIWIYNKKPWLGLIIGIALN